MYLLHCRQLESYVNEHILGPGSPLDNFTQFPKMFLEIYSQHALELVVEISINWPHMTERQRRVQNVKNAIKITKSE